MMFMNPIECIVLIITTFLKPLLNEAPTLSWRLSCYIKKWPNGPPLRVLSCPLFIPLSRHFLLYACVSCKMRFQGTCLNEGHIVRLTNSAWEGLEDFCVDSFAANITRYDTTNSTRVFIFYLCISWLLLKETCTCVTSQHLALDVLFERHVAMEVSIYFKYFSLSFEF